MRFSLSRVVLRAQGRPPEAQRRAQHRAYRMVSALALGVLAINVSPAPVWAQAQSDAAPPSTAERAAGLVARMTLDEKLAMIHGLFPLSTPVGPPDMIPSAGYVPGVPRLGIPTLRESDASLGVANQLNLRKGDVATALPSGLATAASFDADIAYRGGVMIGAEARAKTFNVLLSGGINLTRDPWGGRNFEYLGEDPLLAGTLGGAAIRGVQSNGIVSTIKHFALNAQETGRHVMDARIDEAALRESDLLAFQIAIEIGRPGSVMCAYNKINGQYACENDALLNGVLKRDWGYRGWVMSDWGAVHTTVRAVANGLDQQSGQELDRAPFFSAPFVSALAAGDIPLTRLDDMVRRILAGMIDSGAIDRPVTTQPQPIDYAANAQVAQDAAEGGIVLLKNDRNLLPLARSVRRIVVIGAHADVGVLSGGGSSQVRSVGGVPIEIPLKRGAAASFARLTYHASSPLLALRAALPGAQISYVDGSDAGAAAAAARAADLAIVFAWQWQTEAQDVESLALPDNQDAMINAVSRANQRTIVVLETGGPVLMPWIARVPAVLAAWYPGQRGGEAIANILTGAANPSGRLPMTFPRSAEQAPRAEAPGLDQLRVLRAAANAPADPPLAPFAVTYVEGAAVGYRWYDRQRTPPLFAFGHGLSYARFAYSGLTASGGATPTISFDVKNVSDRSGADVPQVYMRAGTRDGATLRFVGWQKVKLLPGETRRVTVTVDPRIIADYDIRQPGWHVPAGRYPVSVGRFAGDAALSGNINLSEVRIAP